MGYVMIGILRCYVFMGCFMQITFYIVSLLPEFVNPGLLGEDPVQCIPIRNINYEEEVLKSGVHGPYQFSIDYKTDTLFFSYTNTNSTTLSLQLAYLNLKTKEFGLIKEVNGGFATAINNKAHDVFLGGDRGIYVFNWHTKSADDMDITDKVIWQMFFKDALYFTVYPESKPYVFDGESVSEMPEFKDQGNVKVIAVTKNGNYMFANSTGHYIYDVTTQTVYEITDFDIDGFATDVNQSLYFVTSTSIFYFDEDSYLLEELLTTDTALFGVAISKEGHIIYGNESYIMRLKPTQRRCLRWDEPYETQFDFFQILLYVCLVLVVIKLIKRS